MPFESDNKLLHYHLVEKIGEGGMGVVWKAEDTKLRRPVALKFLTEKYLARPDLKARFHREARLAAALNHPSICTIYEVAEIQPGKGHTLPSGQQLPPGTPFISMELIEGDSLKEILRRSRSLPLDDLLRIGVHIGEGLAVAHAKGIVHRDLKPGNVMLTADGRAKILDFGLAKPLESAEPSDAVLTQAETVSDQLSREGMVVGTSAYMSPEQAKGERLDTRSDIFSFGIMLYEMAAGVRPFRGDTPTTTRLKIIEAEPELLPDTSTDVPPDLERIIRRCLKKKPEERYNDSRDLVASLKDLREETSSGKRRMVSQAKPPTALKEVGLSLAARRRNWLGLAIVGMVIAGLGVGFSLYWLATRRPAGSGKETLFQRMKMTQLTSTGKSSSAAISPDGNYVVHVVNDAGKQALWVLQVATGSDVEIVPAADVFLYGTTFSSDGNYVYYVMGTRDQAVSDLYRVPTLGGTPRKLVEDLNSGITFSPDGKRMVFRREKLSESALVVASADGTGEKKIAVRTFPEVYQARPVWSPDGKVIATSTYNLSGGVYGGVAEVPAEGGSERPISSVRWQDIYHLVWVPDGSGLFVIATEKSWASDLQIYHLAYPSGEASRVTNDLNNYGGLSITRDGQSLVTTKSKESSGILVVSGTDAGAVRQIIPVGETDDGRWGLSWAHDGRIVYASNAGNQYDLWITDTAGGRPKRLTQDEFLDLTPIVAPDGRYIVFSSGRGGEGSANLWKMDLSSGKFKQLTKGEIDYRPLFTPDEQWVVYISVVSGIETLWKVPIEGGDPIQLTEFRSGGLDISPDGKWIAFGLFDETSNKLNLAVMPFDGGEPVKVFEMERWGKYGLWTPDGRGLAYEVNRDGIDNVWIQPLDGGPPKQWTHFEEGEIFWMDWSPDGESLALSHGKRITDIVLLTQIR